MKVLYSNLSVLGHHYFLLQIHYFLLQIHANSIKRKETTTLNIVRKQL